MQEVKLTRRDFLKISAAVGGGLVVGFSITACDKAADSAADAKKTSQISPDKSVKFSPNAWVTIGTDDQVTVMVASSEMGQGIMTAISMLLADELDADWSKVKAEFAPAQSVYRNPLLGQQATGGSTAIRGFWNIVRKAGAVAREALIQTAAQRWKVDSSSCKATQGKIIHAASKRSLRYGELVVNASKLALPKSVLLKDPGEYTLIGKSTPRLDTPAKVDGSAIFGMDVQLPGLLTATIARCPVFGGKSKSFNAKSALKVKGVKKVVKVSNGIAVIAEHYWAAKQGLDALKVVWDMGSNASLDTETINKNFENALNKGGITEKNVGSVGQAIKVAAKTVEATYSVPYQAHACMEPMNATADVRKNQCDIYVSTQAQTGTQRTAMKITGLPEGNVFVHTTFLGGGFGRRSEQDFVVDAVECSKLMKKPVKVIWSREDDLMHDYYRPSTYNKLRGGIDAKGKINVWEHRIAGSSILARRFPSAGSLKSGKDGTSTEGATNIPYDIDNAKVDYAMVNTAVPVGFWRSVGSSQNAFITECFMDELAALSGRDPLDVRLELMTNHPRHKSVLQLAADKAGWKKKPGAGRARGIAVAESFGSYVAQVAEVSIDRGKVRVHKIVCAIDCGIIVNPDTVRAQMESGIVYGLTATLKSEITIKQGRVQQTNFDSFALLGIHECPEIEVHFVKSTESPGGVGEPGLPPTAPAVANAVFALTGKPVRSLPVRV